MQHETVLPQASQMSRKWTEALNEEKNKIARKELDLPKRLFLMHPLRRDWGSLQAKSTWISSKTAFKSTAPASCLPPLSAAAVTPPWFDAIERALRRWRDVNWEGCLVKRFLRPSDPNRGWNDSVRATGAEFMESFVRNVLSSRPLSRRIAIIVVGEGGPR